MRHKPVPFLLVALMSVSGPHLLAQQATEGGVEIRAGRIQNGERSGRRFYGYTSVEFTFPHSNGGTLSFTVWNDQHRTRPSTRNFIRYSYGLVRESIALRTSSSDLKELYVESPNEWGPAGGKVVELDVPAGIGRVEIGNEGSETGIEITDIEFLTQPASTTSWGPCGEGQGPVTVVQPPRAGASSVVP